MRNGRSWGLLTPFVSSPPKFLSRGAGSGDVGIRIYRTTMVNEQAKSCILIQNLGSYVPLDDHHPASSCLSFDFVHHQISSHCIFMNNYESVAPHTGSPLPSVHSLFRPVQRCPPKHTQGLDCIRTFRPPALLVDLGFELCRYVMLPL